MKDGLNSIYETVTRKRHNHRTAAFLTAMAILVTVTVPFLTAVPGISMVRPLASTEPDASGGTYDAGSIPADTVVPNSYGANGNIVDGTVWSPGNAKLLTLLFGEGTGTQWLNGAQTLEDALKKAEDEYFLGLASDFCALTKGDFTVYHADAEGRLAIGGDLTFNNVWNYQVGSGDFAHLKPMPTTDSYTEDNERTGFAHLICGGKLYRINTISTGNYDEESGKADSENWHRNGNTVVYDPEDDMYKKLLINPAKLSESLWYDQYSQQDVPYSESAVVEYPGTDADCENHHSYLGDVNLLAQMYQFQYIKELIDYVYDKVDGRSEQLAVMQGIPAVIDGNHIKFEAPNTNAKTVYFTLNEWPSNARSVEFKNIPENASVVVNVGGKAFDILEGSGGTIDATFNGETFSNVHTGNSFTDNDSNNNILSERVLYNFYEATSGKLSGNFNGTILAPKADVTAPTDKCYGHLSGAMIAKSFDGGLEFGYRPYRGSADIIGLHTGYAVPVEKYVEGTTTRLENAHFVLEEIYEAEEGTTAAAVYRWLSKEDQPVYVPVPLKVDYTETYTTAFLTTTTTTTTVTETVTETELPEEPEDGNDPEAPPEAPATTETTSVPPETEAEQTEEPEEPTPTVIYPTFNSSYIIREEKAPARYIQTDKYYQIDVTEKVNQIGLNGTPNNVDYTIAFRVFNSGSEAEAEIPTIQFSVIDSGDNDPKRTIMVDGENKYQLSFLTNEKGERYVNAISKWDGTAFQPVQIDPNKAQVIDEHFYYDPLSLMVMPLPQPENIPYFENRPGLLFEKVDELGKPLKGATITFSVEGAGWTWDPDSSDSCLIDFTKLGTGEYIFTEEDDGVPAGYEQADPITISWNKETGSFTYNGQTYTLPATIQMVDQTIYGMKLSLYKYDGRAGAAPDTPLANAKFDLYAQDGTLIKSDLTTDETGKVDFNLETAESSPYVRDGYLTPGTYFLRETERPDPDSGTPFTQPDDLYFTVAQNNSGYEVRLKPPGGTEELGYSPVHASDWSEHWKHHGYLSYDGNLLNQSSGTAISNIISVEIIVKNPSHGSSGFVLYSDVEGIDQKGRAASDYVDVEYENESCQKIEISNLNSVTLSKLEMQDWEHEIDLKYVKLTASDGTTYIYPQSALPQTTEEPVEIPITVDSEHPSVLQIKNDSKPVNIKVQKEWKNDENFEFLRGEVTVELYRSTEALTPEQQEAYANGGTLTGVTIETWSETWDGDLEQSGTATLNEDNGWNCTWEKLEAFKQVDNEFKELYYYVKETPYPGYDTAYQREGNQLTVTNTMQTVNLNAEKVWDYGNYKREALSEPSSVTVMLEIKQNESWIPVSAKTLLLTGSDWKGQFTDLPAGKEFRIREVSVPVGWKIGTDSNTIDTAGMTQEQLNGETMTITNVPDIGSLKVMKEWENDPSVDEVKVKLYRVEENSAVSGGYHDAGDHVMFGLPQGYTASMLGWSYNEFKDSFDNLGQTEHYKIIAKRFADFFYDSARTDADGNITELLVQKGDGQTDHDYWGAPEAQGERTDQLFWRSDSGGDIAAEYAATLAQYKVNFPTDPKADAYLERAKNLYEFAKQKPALNEFGVNRKTGTEYDFYRSEDKQDDLDWAAAWLYKATGEEQYKTDLSHTAGPNAGIWSTLNWNRVGLAAAIMNGEINNSWDAARNWLNDYCNSDEYYHVDGWGSARYNCGAQLAALIASKYPDESGIDKEAWAQNQMKYILGDQGIGSAAAQCFVTGFAKNSPKNPHHRAASGTNSGQSEADDLPTVHVLLGALVGGPTDPSGSYQDLRSDYQCNEVALDYNAGLVGAAAGLYHFYQTGITDPDIASNVPGAGVKKTYGGGNGTAAAVNPNENYAKLLQYSLYFYDANMCGSDVDELSALNWRSDCHTDDQQPQAVQSAASPQTPRPAQIKAISTNWAAANLPVFNSAADTTVSASPRTRTRALRLSKAVDLAETLEVQAAKSTPVRLLGASGDSDVKWYYPENWCGQGDNTDAGTYEETFNPSYQNITKITVKFDKQPAGHGFQIKINDRLLENWTSYNGLEYTYSTEATDVNKVAMLIKTNGDNDAKVQSIKFEVGEIIQEEEIDRISVHLVDRDSPTGDIVYFNNNCDYKKVTKIRVVFNQSTNAGCSITENNSSDNWRQMPGNYIDKVFSTPVDITSLKVDGVDIWNNTDSTYVQEIIIYGEPQNTFKVTPTEQTVFTNQDCTVNVSGNTGDIIWKDGDETITPVASDGSTFTFRFDSSGTHTITGTDHSAEPDGGKTGEFTVNVVDFRLNTDSVSFRTGGSGTVEIETNLTDDFTVTCEDSRITCTLDGRTVTVRSDEVISEPVTVTVTSPNGEMHSFTVRTYEGTEIHSEDRTDPHDLLLDEILPLRAYQSGDEVAVTEWSSDHPDIASVDCYGNVTAKRFGTATITADVNGDTVTYLVNVGPLPVDPNDENRIKCVETITLKKNEQGEWPAFTVDNLPLVSPNGNRYIYYIQEEDSNQYIAVDYSGGAAPVDSTDPPVLTVRNKAIKGLPVAGGSGVKGIYYTGGIMILLAAAGYAAYRRRRWLNE